MLGARLAVFLENVFNGGREVGEFEFIAGFEELLRDCFYAGQKHLGSHFTQDELQGKGGHREKGRAVHCLSEESVKILREDGIRMREVERPGAIGIFHQETNDGDDVVDVNPWEPLFSAAGMSSEEETKRRYQSSNDTTVGAEDNTEPDGGDPEAQTFQRLDRSLPLNSDVGQETGAGRRRFIE